MAWFWCQFAYIFWGAAGACWVVGNTLWAVNRILLIVFRGMVIVLSLVNRMARVVVGWLAPKKRPNFKQQSKTGFAFEMALLRTFVVVIILIAVYIIWTNSVDVIRREVEVAKENFPSTVATKKFTSTYSTGQLAGRRFGGLLTSYTGISGIVLSHESVNFCENLGGLWSYKRKRYSNSVVDETARVLVPRYCNGPHTLMTINQYRRIVSRVLVATRNDLIWTRVAQIMSLDSRQLRVLQKVTNSLEGDDLVAYALTELMPTEEGGLNVAVFDFLLRNAGREYVESIPAVYDDRTSFGPYQFTSYAWRNDGRIVEGASIMNNALRNPIPHGSVKMLVGDQHHQAAFLFALYNLSRVIRNLSSSQIKSLERNWKSSHDDIVQFMATAHHNPGGAYDAFRRWLDNGARRNYSISLSNRLLPYARKTQANLREVNNR